MREIKFRVWIEDAQTLRGVTNISFNGSGLLWIGVLGKPVKRNYTPAGNVTSHHDRVSANRCILMQYTGLKDKNGVEIYESDILLLHDTDDQRLKSVVRWIDWGAGFYLVEPHNVTAELKDDRELEEIEKFLPYQEVIGNIYENPELLKN